MSVKQFFLGLVMVGLVLGSFAQEDSLRAENARLKRQLEEYQKLSKTTSNDVEVVNEEKELMDKIKETYGVDNDAFTTYVKLLMANPNSLVAKITKAQKEDDYPAVLNNIESLMEKYPDSPILKSFEKVLSMVKKIRDEYPDLFYGREPEMWTKGYYTNKFGEKTNQSFVTNTSYIEGTFSNSATENSALNVQLLINNPSDIAIQLYEYAGDNPVKDSGPYTYVVQIKGSNNATLKFQPVYKGDRLPLNKSQSRKLHELLLIGGTTKFYIYTGRQPSSQYNFMIEDKDNGYKKIMDSN